jgi:ABC-type antimicrobial peptide transport system permease subunit
MQFSKNFDEHFYAASEEQRAYYGLLAYTIAFTGGAILGFAVGLTIAAILLSLTGPIGFAALAVGAFAHFTTTTLCATASASCFSLFAAAKTAIKFDEKIKDALESETYRVFPTYSHSD